MTVPEFQKKYHEWFSKNKVEAIEECRKVNEDLVGGEAVVCDLGHFGYCLMLKTAYDYVKDIL